MMALADSEDLPSSTASPRAPLLTTDGAPPAAATPHAVKVWILDDDKDMCSLLGQQFQRIGWTLQAFHHPRDLFQALKQDRPDILLLDQLLPEKHGLEVLSTLRLGWERFPVLVLSALSAPSDRIAGLEAGAEDYLSKPFHFRELQLRMERLLQSIPDNASPNPCRLLKGRSFALGELRFEADPDHPFLRSGGEMHRLSRGDAVLLVSFCEQPGQVLSRAHLLQATGSLVTPGQSRTIDVRLSRLRRLLRNLTGDDLIVPERGQGYRLITEVRDLGTLAPSAPRA